MPFITSQNPFLVKHQSAIQGVLSCCDRVIFRGHLPLSYPLGMQNFLYLQHILFKDFKSFALKIGEQIKTHVQSLVESAGRPFRYLQTKIDMENEARQLAQKDKIASGIICGFSKLETCSTYRCIPGEKRPLLKKDLRRILVLYVFLMHPVLGLIHIKLHTWFPLTFQVYANGHEFVARKLDAMGVKYQREQNALVAIENFSAAQACADRFVKQNWRKLFGELAKQFNPLLGKELKGQEYYWVMDQVEYATDVVFDSVVSLASLYPRLVEHAQRCFSPEDVLGFLGRKLTGNFQGEVQTHAGRRVQGVRVKHSVKSNRLKMYDKAGRILRIETVINDPSDFKVRRWQGEGENRQLKWKPLLKGVAWLWRYAEISRGANQKYLEALAVVDDDGRARKLLDRVTESAKWNGKRKRALQPMSPQDQALFLAVMRGGHRLRGFTNGEIAKQLYPEKAQTPGERRRRCGRVTRLLQLLRAHKMIRKVPRSQRYQITQEGEALMSGAIYIRHKYMPKELNAELKYHTAA